MDNMILQSVFAFHLYLRGPLATLPKQPRHVHVITRATAYGQAMKLHAWMKLHEAMKAH